MALMQVASRLQIPGKIMSDRLQGLQVAGQQHEISPIQGMGHQRDPNVIYESTEDGDIRTVETSADDDYESFKNKLRESWDESSQKGAKKAGTRHKQNLSLQFLDISLSEPGRQAEETAARSETIDENKEFNNRDQNTFSAKDFSPPRPTALRQQVSHGAANSKTSQSEVTTSASMTSNNYLQHNLNATSPDSIVVPQMSTQISRKHRRGTSGRSNPALAHRRIDSLGFSEPTKGHRRETSEGFEVIEENFIPPGNTPTPPSPGTAAMPPPVPTHYQNHQYPYYYQGAPPGYYTGNTHQSYNPPPPYYHNSSIHHNASYNDVHHYTHAPPHHYQYPMPSFGHGNHHGMTTSNTQGHHAPTSYAFGNPAIDYSLKPTYTSTKEHKSVGGDENGGDCDNHHRKQESIGSFLATADLFDDGEVGYDSEPDRPLPVHHEKSMSSTSFLRSLSDDNFLRHISHSADEDTDSPRISPVTLPTSDYMKPHGRGEDRDFTGHGRPSSSRHPTRADPAFAPVPAAHQHTTYYCAPTAESWHHGAEAPPPPPPLPGSEYNTPDYSRGSSPSDAAETPELSKEAAKRLRRKCAVPDCPNRVVQGGLCIGHGAKRKTCSHPGCTKNVKKAGLCSTHGPARKRCEAEGCSKVAVQGGRCIAHGAKKKMCSMDDCTKQAIMGGMCKKHYDQVNNIVKVRAPRKKNASPKGAKSPESSGKKTLPLALPPIPGRNDSREQSSHQRGLSIFQDMSTVDKIISNGVTSYPSPTMSGKSGDV
ncbi:hypothetical protein ACHAXS_009191 [Conticribra weissflogii]